MHINDQTTVNFAKPRRGRILRSSLLVGVLVTAAWAGLSWAGDDAEEPCPTIGVFGGDHGAHAVRQNRPYLGVELTGLSPELRRHFGVGEDAGVMVSKVIEDSAAERAGLAVGDIITGFDDQPISSTRELSQAMRLRRNDEVVAVEYWRDGQWSTAAVTLGQKSTCALDLSGMVGGLEHLKDLDIQIPNLQMLGQMEGLKISGEALEEVMESLKSIDWEEHLIKIEALHDENFEDQVERLHEQMERLEIRFESGEFEGEIEKRLEAAEHAYEAQREAREEARRAAERARIQARAARQEALVHREASAEARAAVERAAEQARVLAEQARRREEEQRAKGEGGETV